MGAFLFVLLTVVIFCTIVAGLVLLFCVVVVAVDLLLGLVDWYTKQRS